MCLTLRPILFAAAVSAVPSGALSGVVHTHRLASGEAVAMDYRIYLPEAAADTSRRFPVVYLLHGYGASSREWTDVMSLSATLDAMIAAGEIAPVIAVMPDAGKSWYVDSSDHGGPGDYETAIASTLIAEIETRFPARSDSRHRAIAGLSMGGYGALRLAFKYPERFGAVAALSAGLFKPSGLSWRHGPGGRRWNSRHQWYANTFGAPFDLASYNDQNPFTYVAALEECPELPRVMLIAGDDDQMGAYDGAVEMFLDLRRIGIKPELRIQDGGHDHEFWREMLREMFLFLDRGWHAEGESS